jgi:broad specificity phosphatase PhoE
MRLLFTFSCLLFHCLIWSQTSATTTIYLIRHCEKAPTLNDPELSEEGKLRAANWAKYFEDTPIDGFYTTATKRTATTCSIIADSKNKEIQFYNHNSFSLVDIVETHQGQTLLIVGHSNTLPTLLNTFLGQEVYQILAENEYSSLFTITIQGDTIKHDLKQVNK